MRTALAFLGLVAVAAVLLGQNFPQPGPGAPGFFGAGSIYADATACWSFNDPADLGNDDCTDTYDLTPQNTPTAMGGALSYAMNQDDTDTQHATAADSADLSGGSTGFTVCVWGKPNAPGDNDVWIKKDDYSSEREFVLRNEGDIPRFYQSNSCTSYENYSQAPYPPGVVAGGRYFVCATYNASTKTSNVYMNGDFGTPATLTTGIGDCDDSLEVGGMAVAGGNKDAFNGTLGPVYWWKGTVVAEAVLDSLYNSGKGMACAEAITEDSSMTRCWDLDEDPSGGAGAYKDEVSGGASDNMSPSGSPTRAAGLVERSDSGMGVRTVAASSQELTMAWNPSGDTTLCAWLHAEAASSNFPAVQLAGGQDGQIVIYNGGGTPYAVVEAFDGAWKAAGGYGAPYTKGDWVLVCGVQDWGTGLSIYVNGSQHLTTTALGSEGAGTGTGNVGRTRSGVLQDTTADMVAVWSEAKDSTFMTNLYNAGAGTFYAALDLRELLVAPDSPRFAWSNLPIKSYYARAE